MTLRHAPFLLAIAAFTFLRVAAAPATFDLPAQPANLALMAFAQQANVEVLFSSSDLKKVQTKTVAGSYEPAVALQLLLDGTGFVAKRNTAGKFVVQRDRSPPRTPLSLPDAVTPQAGYQPDPRPMPESEKVITLDRVIVTPSRFGIGDEQIAKSVTLSREDLQTLPQIGEDLYRAVCRLPGLGTDDMSASFLVRGAPNRQVLARLDGMDLIEPFHLRDYDRALSIVDLETVGSIDLITGGLTVDHGDRLAGAFMIETQSAPETKRRTTLGLSVTDIRATDQGRFADGDGQWMVAARNGTVDLALQLGGNDADRNETHHYDFSSKIQYRPAPNHAVSFHVLHAGDTFKRRGDLNDPGVDNSYNSTFLWGRWLGSFHERISGEAVLSYSKLGWHRKGSGNFNELDDSIHPFSLKDDRQLDVLGLRNDWTVNLTEHALVRTGFEFKSGEASYDYAYSYFRYVLSGGNLGMENRTYATHQQPSGTHTGAYIAPRFQPWTPFIIEQGIRFDRDTQSRDSNWSPRLNLSYTIGRTAVRAAWGIYHQAQGLHELSIGDRETTFKPSEHAEQRVIGISHKLDSGVELRLEAYERLTTHLRPHWFNLTEPFQYFPETLYDRVKLSPKRGRARGVELYAEHRNNGRFGWAMSYAYAKNEELIGNRWTPGLWDQRHTFNVDVTYVPARNWRLSAAWQIHSGWPYTDQIFTLQPLNNGTYTYSWTYGPTNALHGATYHRLDLRATRTYQLKNSTLRVFVDVWNAYNQKNEVGFNDHYAYISNNQLVVVKTPGEMLPILPSFGLSWEF